MTFDQLPPRIQRIVFLAAEIIREEPRTATEHLISLYSIGLDHGTNMGLSRALDIVTKEEKKL